MKALVTILLFSAAAYGSTATWPQFRGPNGAGVAEDARPPSAFGPATNLAWKTAIPSGVSSPCIAGGRVFLTGAQEGTLLALCFDANSGKELWRRESPPGKKIEHHRISSPAVATPTADDQRVYVYFASFGIVAYDFAGAQQWKTPLPVEFVMNGSGTSPIVHDGLVILNCDQDEGDSFIVALDARNGKQRWRASRAGFPGSYSTPAIWKGSGAEQVVVSGSQRVIGYDLITGTEQWSAAVLSAVTVSATPVSSRDGMLFVMSRGAPANSMGTFADFLSKNDKDGDGKISRDEGKAFAEGGVFRGIDRDKDGFITDKDWSAMTNFFTRGESGIFALRAPEKGDVTKTHVAWKRAKGVAGISSPLVYRDRVYAVQDGGRLTCWDCKTGEPVFEQERVGAEGEYYASPIAANGRIFVASTKGVVTSIRAAEKLEVEARNQLGESIIATPAIVGNTLYVRSARHLWAFKE